MSGDKTQRGVTLVELAVSIVIIAVLLAAITAGKNLVRAAKVRAVLSESEDFRGAFIRFQEKYSDLPGDMIDATGYFSGTANGNGNEEVVWGGDPNEGARAWQHLQKAGMIGASEMSGTGADAVIDTNVPGSKFPGGGFYVHYTSALSNHIGFGAQDGSGANDGDILKPEDAYNIDIKADDGVADGGRVQGDGTNCRQSGDDSLYDFTYDTAQCHVTFKLDNQF